MNFKITQILLIIITLIGICGCTFSFNNISTEGEASDIFKENESADAKIDPVLAIPATTL